MLAVPNKVFIYTYIVTGSGKTRLLEQAKILVINIPNDRAEHRLHNDMLSVHIYLVHTRVMRVRNSKP